MPGDLLYATLLKFGLAEGEYRADPGDGLQLKGAIILNAVKCLPPANKPEPRETRLAGSYFEVALWPACRNVTRLHRARARSRTTPRRELRRAACRRTQVRPWRGACAARRPDIAVEAIIARRYNQNTGRLDAAMFEACSSDGAVIAQIRPR